MAADNWSRVLNTTIAEYIREEEINVLRNRKVLALLKERGRITFNHGGTMMDWKVRYKRASMRGYADSDVLTFERVDRWQTAQLPWRGYAAVDAISKLEELKNKGPEAIIKVYSQIPVSLMEDVNEHFGDALYHDGNASGYTKGIHGVESFFGVSGANASAPIGTPSDTYAGLSTTLANYGGTASSTWPTGYTDVHADFWTPLIVDYTSAVATASGGWSSSTKTWPNTCREALRYGILKGKKNKSRKGMLDLILFNDELYRQFLNSLDAEERATVKRGEGSSGLYALGFTDMVNFDGVDIGYEYGCPETVGYGWNMQNMELCSLQGQLFVANPVDLDPTTQTKRFSVDMFGNLRCNPRHMVKWDNVS